MKDEETPVGHKRFSTENVPPDDGGWDDVEQMIAAKDEARNDERLRCAAIIAGELDHGRLRGVPETSGIMKILLRVQAAIANG
jgi:hypothetical protein